MFLLMDIGNTSITFGISKGKDKYFSWRSRTSIAWKKNLFRRTQLKYLTKGGIDPDDVTAVVVCSVVPQLNVKIKEHCKDMFKSSRFFLIGKDIPVPIKNKYRKPQQVGKDRLVNALAAKCIYSIPVLVVDFGTAITIDVVSGKGEYLGGVIVPGINLSLKVLHENTAMLPLLNPKKPKNVLGQDTENSILSGIFYGYSFLVDGLIKKLKATLKGNPVVVATGGNLKIMKPLCREIDHYQPDLMLKGIEIAYSMAKNKAK